MGRLLLVCRKLRRQIGKKARDLGGNAILGYRHHFDMIEKSIIARGIGTVAVLAKVRVMHLY